MNKRYTAIWNNENPELINWELRSKGISVFDIIALDENEARQLITEKGYNPDDYTLERDYADKDQKGRGFKKGIRYC